MLVGQIAVRKQLTLGAFESAIRRITADRFCRLFVNGV